MNNKGAIDLCSLDSTDDEGGANGLLGRETLNGCGEPKARYPFSPKQWIECGRPDPFQASSQSSSSSTEILRPSALSRRIRSFQPSKQYRAASPTQWVDPFQASSQSSSSSTEILRPNASARGESSMGIRSFQPTKHNRAASSAMGAFQFGLFEPDDDFRSFTSGEITAGGSMRSASGCSSSSKKKSKSNRKRKAATSSSSDSQRDCSSSDNESSDEDDVRRDQRRGHRKDSGAAVSVGNKTGVSSWGRGQRKRKGSKSGPRETKSERKRRRLSLYGASNRNKVHSSSNKPIIPHFGAEIKRIVFVDYDNWQPLFDDLAFLSDDVFLWVFGKDTSSLPDSCRVLGHPRVGSSKDAADACICFHMGKMDDRLDRSVEFFVLTGDGFAEELIQNSCDYGRRIVSFNPHLYRDKREAVSAVISELNE